VIRSMWESRLESAAGQHRVHRLGRQPHSVADRNRSQALQSRCTLLRTTVAGVLPGSRCGPEDREACLGSPLTSPLPPGRPLLAGQPPPLA